MKVKTLKVKTLKRFWPLCAAAFLVLGLLLGGPPAASAEPVKMTTAQKAAVDIGGADAQLAAAAGCNYCLIFHYDTLSSGNFGLYVTPDSAYTCANTPNQDVLFQNQNTKSHLSMPDAGCVFVPTGYDMRVHDIQKDTYTWVCSYGWKRLAEPPAPSQGYYKWLLVSPDSGSHC